MTHEYGDPLGATAIAQAVARAVALKSQLADLSFEAAAEQAVHEHICSCALDIEDAVEKRRSGMHSSVVDEVMRLAKREAERQHRSEIVDEASRESFPASDPPGWICD